MSFVASLSFLLLAVAATRSLAAREDWVGKGDLKLDVLTETFVQGTYAAISGSGIHFSCGQDSLLITTLDGHPLVAGEPSVGEYRVVTFDGNDFIVKGDLQYAVPRSFSSVRGTTDENTLASVVRRVEEISGQSHNARFEASVRLLVTRTETTLLKEVAFALGEGEGVTGVEYPVVLPFFRIALIVEGIFDNQTITESPNRIQKRASYDCYASEFATCPPCQRDNCVGMCGRMCSCWSFVCGDCCYQQFCWTHDLCCRDRGFFSTQCFAVVFTGGVNLGESTCHSSYYCAPNRSWWG